MASEGLEREGKLRRRADYQRCYRRGWRRSGALVILFVHDNDLGRARLGITTTRKVGNSVVRHRLKRWVRESYRRWAGRHELPPVDVVVHVKPAAAGSTFAAVSAELRELLGRLSHRRGGR